MNIVIKSITTLTAATMITVPSAHAQESAASSGPFTPDMLAIGLGLGSLTLTDIPTTEKVRIVRALYGDVILGWYIGQFVNAITYFQLGFFRVRGDVESVSNSTTTFPTSGNYTDWGGFLGLGIIIPLVGSSTASSAVVSSSASGASSRTDKPITVSAAASVGVSRRKFDAFNGSFVQRETGPFLRLEANLNIPLTDRLELSPGLVYHMYDDDLLESDNLRAVIRLNYKF